MNSLALTASFRFHDPELVFVSSHFGLKSLVLLGTIIARWHEVEVLAAVESLHARVSFVEAVFSCYLITPREVINLLESA